MFFILNHIDIEIIMINLFSYCVIAISIVKQALTEFIVQLCEKEWRKAAKLKI